MTNENTQNQTSGAKDRPQETWSRYKEKLSISSRHLTDDVDTLLENVGEEAISNRKEYLFASAASLRVSSADFKGLVLPLGVAIPFLITFIATINAPDAPDTIQNPAFWAFIASTLPLIAAILLFKDKGSTFAAAAVLDHRALKDS